MMAWNFFTYWWRSAMSGDVCASCMQPGHTASSCKHPLWAPRPR